MTLQDAYGSYLEQGGVLGVYCPREVLFRLFRGELQWAEPVEDDNPSTSSWMKAPGLPQDWQGVYLYDIIPPHPCATLSCFGCRCGQN